MNYDLRKFLFKKKYLDEKLINDILCNINEHKEWDEHSYTYNQDVSKMRKNEKEFNVKGLMFINSDYNNKLMEIIWQSYHDYCSYVSKDISLGLGWDGYTPPRINKYEKGTYMSPHYDNIKSIFEGERKGSPILTSLGLLQNSIKGGDLLMWDNQKIEMQPGEIIVFPSCFLYGHSVTEILEGTRISFVSWAW